MVLFLFNMSSGCGVFIHFHNVFVLEQKNNFSSFLLMESLSVHYKIYSDKCPIAFGVSENLVLSWDFSTKYSTFFCWDSMCSDVTTLKDNTRWGSDITSYKY